MIRFAQRGATVVFALLATAGVVWGESGCGGATIGDPGTGRSSSELGTEKGSAGGGSTSGGSGSSGGVSSGGGSSGGGSGCGGPATLVCPSGEHVCDVPGPGGYCTEECSSGPCMEIACKAPPPCPSPPPPPPSCCPVGWSEGSGGFCCPPEGIEAPCFEAPKVCPPPPTCGTTTCATDESCCEGVPFSEPTCIAGKICPL